jgi:hypothetical protein
MDKNKQIKDLIAKGFTRNQAAMICLSNEHKMQEGGDTIRIDDSRRVKYASNTPVDPNTDLVSGDYRSNIIQDIVNAALKNGVDPNTAIALAMQESKIGNTDENLGHIVGGSYRGNEANDMTKTMSDKMHEGRKLGRKSDEELLQMYNGTGKVFPTTEQDYHGYKMKKIYGVPIPKQGIDMGKENLYGKQIVDIRDNVIKKNKTVQDTVKKLKNNFNFFEGAPYKNTIPTGEEIFQSGAYNNVNPKLFQQGGFTGARLDVPSEIGYNFNGQFQQQPNPFENTGYANYSQNLEQKYPIPNSKLAGFQQYDTFDENLNSKDFLKYPIDQEETETAQKPNPYFDFSDTPQDNVGLGLYTFGQGLGDKDPWKISTGAGLALVSGLRQSVSGFGTGRQNEMARKEMQRKQFEDMRKPTMMKEGGHIEALKGKKIISYSLNKATNMYDVIYE